MALSNAERQARWRHRMHERLADAKHALEAAVDGNPLRNNEDREQLRNDLIERMNKAFNAGYRRASIGLDLESHVDTDQPLHLGEIECLAIAEKLGTEFAEKRAAQATKPRRASLRNAH